MIKRGLFLCAVLLGCGVSFAEPLPTPRAGETTKVPLQPTTKQPPTVAVQPLAITHHQPEGTEQEPPALSVTFNQPMVPVTSVGNLAGPAPIRVEPEVPGQWKSIGTTTLQLQPKERVRFGTRFRVTVPGTLRSATGQTLGKDFVYTFATPVPRVTQTTPSDQSTEIGLEPAILLWFNQRVSGEKMTSLVKLATADGKDVPLVVVPREKWPSDQRLAGYHNQTTVAAFVPKTNLVPNTKYRLEVQPGVVGDEGPLGSAKKHVATFTTYAPFAVRAVRCGECNTWNTESEKTCTVGNNLCVTFNHAVTTTKPESFVSVTPAPKDSKQLVNYNSIQLQGHYTAETTYRVRVAAGLKDTYGQTLGSAWSADVRYEHMPTSVEPLVVQDSLIEKSGNLVLPLRVVNADAIPIDAYRLSTTQLRAVQSAVQHQQGSDSFVRALAELKAAKVSSWIERPKLPMDKSDVHNVALRNLIAEHGGGSYLFTIGKANYAVLLQVTDLGITARYDSDKMVVLVTSIATGKPMAGVNVAVMDDENKMQPAVRTSSDGVAVVKAVARGEQNPLYEVFVTATTNNDRSYLRATSYGDDGRSLSLNWGHPRQPAYDRTMFYPDRDLYRPGETVHIYGISRSYAGGVVDKLGLPARAQLTWTATSSRNRELGRGQAQPTLFGTFYFSFKLPEQIDLGNVTIQTPLGTTYVKVEEYRAPEFEVTVKTPAAAKSNKDMLYGETIRANVSGRYLFGAPMKQADVKWTLYADSQRFSPPNFGEFNFGSAPPRWDRYERHYRYDRGPSPVQNGQGKLDANGRLELAVPYGAGPAYSVDPTGLILEAQVTDVSRQAVSGRVDVRMHPGDRYIGLRQGNVLEANHAAPIEVVAVALDGSRSVGANVTITAALQASEMVADVDEDGNATTKSQPKRADVKPCTVTTGATTVTCAMMFPVGGAYLLTAKSQDSTGRAITTHLHVDVMGKDTVAKDTQAQRAELRFDRTEYQPGQTAHLTVRAPFAEGVALITEERRGLVGHQIVKILNHVGTAKIAVREDAIPNLEVSATVIRARGKERPRAAWAVGSTRLNIAVDPKRLAITLTPQKTIARPGETVRVDVVVRDAQQRPVKSWVSLVAVDEAVLGLTGFQTPNPLPFFHYAREHGVALAELLKRLLPEEGNKHDDLERRSDKSKKAEMSPSVSRIAAEESASGAGPGGGASGPAATVRRLFLTTPGATMLQTNDQGTATFSLPLPGNLTRFRVMAVAADERDRFGSKEATITTQQPLQLRPTLPRFANTADTFSAGVIIDNQLPQGGTAEVTLQAEGVELVDPAAQRVTLGSGDAKEVTWAVKANKPGTAKFRFSVRLGNEADAVEATLPVWIPATAESFATYGTSTTNVAQPIDLPKDVLPDFGGLAITIGSSAMNGLQDAARYLVEYPYGCAEQVSSRAMPILVLGEIVEQFKLGGVETLALGRKHAQIAVDKLVAGQRSDGSWGTWMTNSDTPRADLTAYVLLVLRRAKEANLNLPDDTAKRGTAYLQQWLQQNAEAKAHDSWSRQWILDVQALSLFALSDWGQSNDAMAKRLYANERELDLFARGMLAAVFHRSNPQSPERAHLLREILNRAIQTPSTVRFQETQTETLQLLMHSSSRTDAILLLVLLELEPKNELIPKVVRGLMDARVHGRWDSTQANSYALWALSRYFKAYESAPTAFVAEIFVGKTKLGESKFAEKSLREEILDVPMSFLQTQPNTKQLTIGKTGSGRFYYRVGLKYAPRATKLPPLDQGFTVTRKYESATGNPADVKRLPDGSWEIAAGSYVRVLVDVVVQDRRFYVVVDDALPAGLELVNSSFKTSARTPTARDPDEEWWGGYPSWRFNHRELRDERALHFADELTPGSYHVNVLARATVRGQFVVPPTRAEEMYHPEVFGRSGSERVTVK